MLIPSGCCADGRAIVVKVLVTGSAGFIGFHVCRSLLERGDEVVGVDNLNDYYDVALKKARLAELAPFADRMPILNQSRHGRAAKVLQIPRTIGEQHDFIQSMIHIEYNEYPSLRRSQLKHRPTHFWSP